MPQYRATGLLWLALGCALLRQQQPQEAAVALQHSRLSWRPAVSA